MDVNPISTWPLLLYCQKVLPTVYDDSLSYYEAVCKQSHVILELAKQVDGNTERIAALERAITDLDEALRAYADSKDRELYDELYEMIVKLTEGTLEWDVTLGQYGPTKDVQRNIFNDVTVHSMTVGEFEDWADGQGWTVDDLADCGLNCRGWAVLNYWLLDRDRALPDRYAPTTGEGDTFTVGMLQTAKIDSKRYVFAV